MATQSDTATVRIGGLPFDGRNRKRKRYQRDMLRPAKGAASTADHREFRYEDDMLPRRQAARESILPAFPPPRERPLPARERSVSSAPRSAPGERGVGARAVTGTRSGNGERNGMRTGPRTPRGLRLLRRRRRAEAAGNGNTGAR